ncbi:MAG TPA: hypothetical protein VET47_00130 [Candidatus Limnocylindrales bacterium]|nr:hypothetical protein [Candidatus Limnocylindrales bacterium]
MMKYVSEDKVTTHATPFSECISEIMREVEGMKVKAVTGDFDGMMEHMRRIDDIVYPNMENEQLLGNCNAISN